MKLTKRLLIVCFFLLITFVDLIILPPKLAYAQSCTNPDGSFKANGTSCSGCGPVDCAPTGCGSCTKAWDNGCRCGDSGDCLHDYGCTPICPSNNTTECTASCSGCNNDIVCPPVVQTHKKCAECNRCVTINGPGDDECNGPEDCRCATPTPTSIPTLTPTPTPTTVLNCQNLYASSLSPKLGDTITLTCEKNSSYTGGVAYDFMLIQKANKVDEADANPVPTPTPFVSLSTNPITTYTFPAGQYGYYLFMCRVCAGRFCTDWQQPAAGVSCSGQCVPSASCSVANTLRGTCANSTLTCCATTGAPTPTPTQTTVSLNLLTNGGLENGDTNWAFGRVSRAVYPASTPPGVRSGNFWLDTAGPCPDCNSAFQEEQTVVYNHTMNAVVGKTYQATIYFRSPQGGTFDFFLWAMGGTTEHAQTSAVGNSTWKEVKLTLPIVNAGHNLMRIQMYLKTPNTQLQLDDLSLSVL